MGGRYGSASSGEERRLPSNFFSRYESITKRVFEAAAKADVPIYIAVDRAVHTEYDTFLKNRENEGIQYAHVQSVNVFVLLHAILNMPKNNPVFTFDKPAEVEDWLRLQWAGLFGEMLRRRSEHAQLASLADQVNNLSEVNKTLKRYLEEVVSRVSKEKAAEIISSEESRLKAARERVQFARNPFVVFAANLGVPGDQLSGLLHKHHDAKGLFQALSPLIPEDERPLLSEWSERTPKHVRADVEAARAALGLPHDETLAASGGLARRSARVARVRALSDGDSGATASKDAASHDDSDDIGPENGEGLE